MKNNSISEKLAYLKSLLSLVDNKESAFYGERDRIERVIKKYENMKEPD